MLQGLIATIKDGFGFIRYAEREVRMFFHFSEMMDPSIDIKVQDEVEFTIIQVPTIVLFFSFDKNPRRISYDLVYSYNCHKSLLF